MENHIRQSTAKTSGRREIKAEITMIRDASSHEQGKQLAAAFISRYKNIYPSLIKVFREEQEALLNHLKIPVRHRRSVKTTNLIEKSFEEERRRTSLKLASMLPLGDISIFINNTVIINS